MICDEERFEISVNQEDVQNIINCYEKDIEYIKQLEQENQSLKEENTRLGIMLEDRAYEELKVAYQSLKDRTEKAIEYIENKQLFDFEYDEEELFEYITDLQVKDDLSKILKGDK